MCTENIASVDLKVLQPQRKDLHAHLHDDNREATQWIERDGRSDHTQPTSTQDMKETEGVKALVTTFLLLRLLDE
jgi:hypothetical protein